MGFVGRFYLGFRGSFFGLGLFVDMELGRLAYLRLWYWGFFIVVLLDVGDTRKYFLI